MMEAPTAKASKALHSVGLSSTQLALDMHKPEGLVVALTDLKTHMDKAGLSAVKQAQVIAAVFGGGRSSAGVQTLMNNLTTLDEKTKGVTAGVGKFGEAWAKTTETAKFKLSQTTAALQAAGVRLGNDLLPAVVRVAGAVGKIADAFSHLPSSAQTAIIGIGLTAGPLVKMAMLVLKARDAWIALRASKLAQVGVDATVGAAESGLAAKTAAEGAAATGASRALGGAGLAGALGKVGMVGLAVAPVIYALTTKTRDFHRVTQDQTTAVQRYGLTLGVGLTALNGAKSGADRMRGSFAAANVTMVDGRHKALAYHDALKRLNMTVHTTVLTTYIGKVAAGTSVPGPTRRMAAGGILDEPVLGVGLRTGTQFSLAERGPEAVVPLGGHGHPGGSAGAGMSIGQVVFNISGAGDPHRTALVVREELLKLGRRNPSVLSGLGVRA